ncbi:hypothetical protein CHELA1G11_10567 [Hyphomicrobiales bacterium]|nr:hypothetical protein CHELA1G11_10567 [Hyphomicrobiales bacterium]
MIARAVRRVIAKRKLLTIEFLNRAEAFSPFSQGHSKYRPPSFPPAIRVTLPANRDKRRGGCPLVRVQSTWEAS